jgi:hypothetical protein
LVFWKEAFEKVDNPQTSAEQAIGVDESHGHSDGSMRRSDEELLF